MDTPVSRALARVESGEPPYRAALAEGVAPATIYRRLRMQRDPEYVERLRREAAERNKARKSLKSKS